mmetsp:Transcript_118478/g.377669  ORF Transcript_118478/g.377669 Transcript_118478/m.377669 type:complete len:222 (+) Transcript_118478:744-1409(+)
MHDRGLQPVRAAGGPQDAVRQEQPLGLGLLEGEARSMAPEQHRMRLPAWCSAAEVEPVLVRQHAQRGHPPQDRRSALGGAGAAHPTAGQESRAHCAQPRRDAEGHRSCGLGSHRPRRREPAGRAQAVCHVLPGRLGRRPPRRRPHEHAVLPPRDHGHRDQAERRRFQQILLESGIRAGPALHRAGYQGALLAAVLRLRQGQCFRRGRGCGICVEPDAGTEE